MLMASVVTRPDYDRSLESQGHATSGVPEVGRGRERSARADGDEGAGQSRPSTGVSAVNPKFQIAAGIRQTCTAPPAAGFDSRNVDGLCRRSPRSRPPARSLESQGHAPSGASEVGHIIMWDEDESAAHERKGMREEGAVSTRH
jgi:hypothetical protein